MKLLLLCISLHITVFAQTQIGQDLDGEAMNDFSGTSVSTSADGATVAIGAPNNSSNGNNFVGHVRVYETEVILSVENIKLSRLTFFPNPARNIITINNPYGIELVNASVYDVLGRLVKKVDLSYKNTMDLSSLKSASYLVVITSENGSISKQVLKE